MAASVGSVDDSLSSSFREEKDVGHFNEAAIVDCQHSVSLKSHKSKVSNDGSTKEKDNTMIRQSTKQLTRHSLQESDEENNEFETSEFRSVIAKRLTEILDQRMKLTSRKTLHIPVKDDTDEGVKLFSSSTSILSHSDQPYTMPVRKKRTYSTSSNSSEEERLAESVVTHEFIFREPGACDSKSDVSSNSLSNKPNQQNNDNYMITDDRTKKKVKKKKSKHKHVADDT